VEIVESDYDADLPETVFYVHMNLNHDKRLKQLSETWPIFHASLDVSRVFRRIETVNARVKWRCDLSTTLWTRLWRHRQMV